MIGDAPVRRDLSCCPGAPTNRPTARWITRAALALAAGTFAAACSTVPNRTANAPVASPPPFSLNGRLVASDGSRRFSATLRWAQGDATRILLTTPLGQALASIDIDAAGTRLTVADGRSYAAGSLSELARRGLGLSLPLEHLPWWLNGRGAPGAPVASDTADSFVQQGWSVRYGMRDDRGRPLRIDAECRGCSEARGNAGSDAKPGAPAGAQSDTLTVRLIIDQWLDP